MREIDIETSPALERCPVCGAENFAPSGQYVDHTQVLSEWEAAIGRIFPDAVKAHYSEHGRTNSALSTCPNCGFGQFFPTVTGTAEFYDLIEAADYYNTEKWEFRLALKIITSLPVTSILDIGCGTGAFLDQLRSDSPSVRRVGHDLNPQLGAILEQHGHDMVSKPLGEMEPATFDAITAFQALEHVADPIGMLREIFTLVRPGGLVLITTPNQAGPVENFSAALTEIPPHHVTRWTPQALQLAVEQVGFTECQHWCEPLARVLWDSYLAPAVEADCWLSSMYGCFIEDLDTASKAEFLHRELQRTELTDLHGSIGQSLMVMARKPLEERRNVD